MKTFLKPRLLLATLGAIFAASSHAEVFVIAQKGDIVSANDIREIYLGEKQFGTGNVRLVPLDNSAAQAEFLAKLLKLDAQKYNATWTKKAFRDGLNPPPVRATDADTIEAVKRTPGAVGYVTSLPTGVSVVHRIP